MSTNLARSINIPRWTLGLDVETKDVIAPAYLLAIGGVLIDNYTLKAHSTLNVTLNPNDPEQAHRTTADFTIKWWETRGDMRYPSQEAYDQTWGGTLSFSEGMGLFDKFMRTLPKDGEMVIPMRGPDFDYPILKDACRNLGLRTPLYGRPLDSHRTVERVCMALEMPPISESEWAVVYKGRPFTPHIAVDDAAHEAYETARMYHFLHKVCELGHREAIEYMEGWKTERACQLINLFGDEDGKA